MIVYFIPAVGHLIAQSEAHGEIRFQLDFILEIQGSFKRSERQRLRIHRRQKLRWPVLQEFQHALITDGPALFCAEENAVWRRRWNQVPMLRLWRPRVILKSSDQE